ncbi:MAG: 5'/3'-nucleotidase SurE [Lentisphaeraceae bacterium]|nr:5'/3'-nucleotidase SurE [Lentisphaeraceae bacterium]
MKILITNDDSFDSPLFHILYDELHKLGHDLTCVMPATEQSWKSKAMTKSGNLALKEISENDRTFYTFEGTPADCINVGLHHVCTSKPDLVISGINLGYNASFSYIMSSGTVGGALEAYLAGSPAISISQKLNSEEYTSWNKTRKFSDATYQKYSASIGQVLSRLHEQLTDFTAVSSLWSLELPEQLDENWQIKSTTPSMTPYGSAFKQNEDGSYSHYSPGLSDNNEVGSDIHTINQGHVALNKIDFKSLF